MERGNPYRERIAEFSDRILNAPDETLIKCQLPEFLRRGSSAAGQRALVVELGCGSGGHALEFLRSYPETLYLGVELRYKRCVRAIEKALCSDAKGLLVVRARAEHILMHIENESVDGFVVHFPDPWEKRRYRSKRLVNDDVVALLWRRLRSGGWLSFKTDHEDYFEQVQKLTMLATGFQVVFESRDLHRDPAAPEHFESEFEKMFKAQAQPVFYLLARKLQKHEGEVAVLKD